MSIRYSERLTEASIAGALGSVAMLSVYDNQVMPTTMP